MPAIRIALACLALACAANARPAAGQVGREPPPLPSVPEGITVYGTGEAVAKPNMVEMGVRVAGRAELADDATLKYKQARTRTLEALAALKLDDLEIKDQGMMVGAGQTGNNNQQQVFINNRMQRNAPRGTLEVSNVLRLRLKGLADLSDDEVLRKVSMLVETLQDSGGSMTGIATSGDVQYGYSPYGNQQQLQAVKFVLYDLKELQDRAYELAVADAKERATRLAKLTGVALGPPLAVQEIMVTGDEPRGRGEGGTIAAANRADTKVLVKLLVRFSIAPAAAAKQDDAEKKTNVDESDAKKVKK